MESELFGYEKGAFTGATSSKPGRFELADGGSLFLDEIGEIPVEMQVKLLRAIQESEFERVGGLKTIKVDVRLITATNRDLEQEIARGNFRDDLYYRLNVVPLQIPPLRKRRGDIPMLVSHIIKKFNERLKKTISGIADDALAVLETHSWPGNIRELENVLERTILFAKGDRIERADLQLALPEQQQQPLPPVAFKNPTSGIIPLPDDADLDDSDPMAEHAGSSSGSLKDIVRAETSRVERELIVKALDETGGNVTQAARLLKISRKSLQMKMKELGLRDREG
jgi:two-component system, NtrC family, response regulator AtoC